MLSETLHQVILVPGLGDDKPLSRRMLEQATSHWSNSAIEVIVHSVLWRNGEAFEPKLLKLLAAIDLATQKGRVSLVGVSAGASLAFNAFIERSDQIYKAASVCGRLKEGDHQLRSLDKMARTSQAFRESVLSFERNEPKLTSHQRQRLMTIRPFFGDELVPHDTAFLEGAENRWVYTPEHMLSIYCSLRLSNQILKFLTE